MKKILIPVLVLFALSYSCEVFAAPRKVESGYIKAAPSRGQKNSGYVHAAPSEEKSGLKEFGGKIIRLFTGQ